MEKRRSKVVGNEAIKVDKAQVWHDLVGPIDFFKTNNDAIKSREKLHWTDFRHL